MHRLVLTDRPSPTEIGEQLQNAPATWWASRLLGSLSMIATGLLLGACSWYGGPYVHQDYAPTTTQLPTVNGVSFSSKVWGHPAPGEKGRREPFSFQIHAETTKGSGGTVAIRSIQVNEDNRMVFHKQFSSLKYPLKKPAPKTTIEGVHCAQVLSRSVKMGDPYDVYKYAHVDMISFRFWEIAQLDTNYHVGQIVTMIVNVAVTQGGRTEQQEVIMRHKAGLTGGLFYYDGP